MNSDQETSGFLPPTKTGFTDELRRQPSSSTTNLTGNTPHHLPGFTKLSIPPTDTTTLDPHLAAANGRAIFTIPATSFRDAVAATPAVDTHNAISPTVSDIVTSPDQEHTTTTTTTTSTPQKAREPPRRNPLRRTLSDTISTVRKPITPAPASSNRSESPQFKRLKKTEEMVTDIANRCWEVRGKIGVSEEDVEDGNPSEAIVEQEEEEVRGEFVRIRRLDDGNLNIKLSCSCGNCFEFLRNRIGCFYRLTI
ncbi:uncharacterized protein LOC111890771 [Lactuca sativa]|uniref:Uncharacterized protein n=1 Tax=Lactuca sativa TaxID=4236 RepID=A0A9R1XD51_LACSA|nr:uncharacterized protein LOC111890771 [Lactuca sativa]KAJ0205954.1 hypothetical protein LSAT_V11C500282590 [Lactuca sativa]